MYCRSVGERKPRHSPTWGTMMMIKMIWVIIMILGDDNHDHAGRSHLKHNQVDQIDNGDNKAHEKETLQWQWQCSWWQCSWWCFLHLRLFNTELAKATEEDGDDAREHVPSSRPHVRTQLRWNHIWRCKIDNINYIDPSILTFWVQIRINLKNGESHHEVDSGGKLDSASNTERKLMKMIMTTIMMMKMMTMTSLIHL